MAHLTDNFNRANSATTINPASDGGSWTVDTGVAGITSNQGYFVSGGTAVNSSVVFIRRDLGGPVQDVQITNVRATTDGNSYIYLNYDPVNQDGYVVNFDSSNNQGGIARLSSGGFAGLAGVTFTAWTGGSTRLRVRSNGAGTITVYQDTGSGWVYLASFTDAIAHAGTWCALGTGTNGLLATERWDDFDGTGSPLLTPRGWVVGAIGWGGGGQVNGPLLSMVQQFTTPTRGAATLSITNSLASAVTAKNLVVVLFWNSSNDAVNNTVSGLSATWNYVRASGYGLAWAIAPGGGTTVTLSISATRTMAMTVCEIALSQVPISIVGGINGWNGAPAPAISTDTITTANTVADFWAIQGNTTAPTTYNDELPALAWSQLTRVTDSTDTIQFGGALPTARASGVAGIAPTDPTSGVGDTAEWQLVIT